MEGGGGLYEDISYNTRFCVVFGLGFFEVEYMNIGIILDLRQGNDVE